MAEDPPLIRQWNLLLTLRSRRRGATIRELAEQMNVGEKTIRRDLELFASLNIPLQDEVTDHGRKLWRLGEGWRELPLRFNFEEAAALYLGRQFLEPLAGTPFWDSAQSAWRKIQASLGETALGYLDRFSQMFHFKYSGFGDYSNKSEVLNALTFGIDERKVVRITYQSLRATEPATRAVHPLKLVRFKGSLYLMAFSPDHDEVRTYKVNRIEMAEVSSLTFQDYRDFDASQHLRSSFGIYDGSDEIDVRLKFMPAVARFVTESNWHPSQVLTRQRDGSVHAQFRLSSTVEIKSWVMGFGSNAVVLEPNELRAEITTELTQMLSAYGHSVESTFQTTDIATRHINNPNWIS